MTVSEKELLNNNVTEICELPAIKTQMDDLSKLTPKIRELTKKQKPEFNKNSQKNTSQSNNIVPKDVK